MLAKVFLGVLMTSLAVEMIMSCRLSYQHKQCYCDCDDNLFIPCTTNCSLTYTDHLHLNHCNIRCHDHLAHCLHVCNNPDVLGVQMSQWKRKYDEVDIEPDMGVEAPTSSEASKTSVSKDSQPPALGMSSSGNSAKKRTKVPVNITSSENISLQQRIVQIEEKKLEVMKGHLVVEKRKLELLEQYVQWRMEARADSTPSVSPAIRGLFIQRVVCFLSPSLGEGIENTQRVG